VLKLRHDRERHLEGAVERAERVGVLDGDHERARSRGDAQDLRVASGVRAVLHRGLDDVRGRNGRVVMVSV
jgi:hypothetical protein